jgi:hypothetical protein
MQLDRDPLILYPDSALLESQFYMGGVTKKKSCLGKISTFIYLSFPLPQEQQKS